MADTKISDLAAVTTPAGTDEFAVNQGGTSKKIALSQIWTPGTAGSPDLLPASPSAYDDEFETLSGWTTLGTLDTLNVTDVPSHLHMQRALSSWDVSGIYKACPSTPFTVKTKISAMRFSHNYQAAGIILGEASPGKLALWALSRDGADGYVAWSKWNSRTSRSGFGPYGRQSSIPSLLYRYLCLIVHSSTSVDLYMSTDGLIYWPLVLAENPGFTIGNVGLAITGHDNGVTGEALVDWIRFT